MNVLETLMAVRRDVSTLLDHSAVLAILATVSIATERAVMVRVLVYIYSETFGTMVTFGTIFKLTHPVQVVLFLEVQIVM